MHGRGIDEVLAAAASSATALWPLRVREAMAARRVCWERVDWVIVRIHTNCGGAPAQLNNCIQIGTMGPS